METHKGNHYVLFQFTPLREGRPSTTLRFCVRTRFQFTPLREGRLKTSRSCPTRKLISIHAPPRGATQPKSSVTLTWYAFQFTPLREGRRSGCAFGVVRGIFQFTPLREGRRGNGDGTHCPTLFQFTPLREGRLVFKTVLICSAISIHAPPRGATAKDMQFLQIFCSTLTNQHGLTIVPRNLSRLFW